VDALGRTLIIIRTDKATNKDVIACEQETTSILKMISHKKHRWVGHDFGHDNFLYHLINGKMMGKATWGRKRWGYCTI